MQHVSFNQFEEGDEFCLPARGCKDLVAGQVGDACQYIRVTSAQRKTGLMGREGAISKTFSFTRHSHKRT